MSDNGRVTFEDIKELQEVFEENYDPEIQSSLQKRAIKIINFMGVENAKKLSHEQVINMLMATPDYYHSDIPNLVKRN